MTKRNKIPFPNYANIEMWRQIAEHQVIKFKLHAFACDQSTREWREETVYQVQQKSARMDFLEAESPYAFAIERASQLGTLSRDRH